MGMENGNIKRRKSLWPGFRLIDGYITRKFLGTFFFAIALIIIIVVVFIIISLDGFSVEANLSATLSCFNNIGPGFGEISSSFGGYSDLSKVVLTIAMLTGRLEIFPMLVLCSRSTWTRR